MFLTISQKVDVMELSLLSGKIANAEKKAAEQYSKLLHSHPKNVRYVKKHFLKLLFLNSEFNLNLILGY